MKTPIREKKVFTPDYENQHWHVNKGIPVVWLIGSLFISIAQFGGLVWYASQFSSRVDVLEKNLALMWPQGDRLTRLEEKVGSLQHTAERIEQLLTVTSNRK